MQYALLSTYNFYYAILLEYVLLSLAEYFIIFKKYQ